MRWREEIDQLHEFFEAYFSGAETSLERAEAVLAPEFTIVGTDGVESDREGTLEMLSDGHAHTSDLTITTSDHRLVLRSEEVIVATYLEHHELSERHNHRLSTVIFVADPTTPNGLLWHHVHETWVTERLRE